MSIIGELYMTKLELAKKEEQLKELQEEYDSYRAIVESNSNNKKVRKIQKHVSWYNREDLKQKAKKVAEQEWLDYSCNEARRQERRREGRRREGRREREEKKRAAERKALDELMEKERRERNRKNKDAN